MKSVLGVVCMSVFYSVYSECSAYIGRLFVVSESLVTVHFMQLFDY